jgi:hypothetical protein
VRSPLPEQKFVPIIVPQELRWKCFCPKLFGKLPPFPFSFLQDSSLLLAERVQPNYPITDWFRRGILKCHCGVTAGYFSCHNVIALNFDSFHLLKIQSYLSNFKRIQYMQNEK